ncbi:hypothetical protein [Geitlerinema sp. PCC 9228]|jgi:hypothetical protein|uniref:hypothetical protein n=1 Tax=Geitlerinema sp. PCC 9228 TaxID=111611 RepID=UPI001114D048|nr:hypothetical protein [Geitlerinema sp. PCC 9228]
MNSIREMLASLDKMDRNSLKSFQIQYLGKNAVSLVAQINGSTGGFSFLLGKRQGFQAPVFSRKIRFRENFFDISRSQSRRKHVENT